MNRDELRAQLINDEGLKLKPYGDLGGKITIGVGHNLTDVGITKAQALDMLDEDIDTTIALLRVNWPPFNGLDGVRQEVLTNMCFNVGIGSFMLFKYMLAACAQGNYKDAASEMRNSVWATQVGPRAVRLAKRMETGE